MLNLNLRNNQLDDRCATAFGLYFQKGGNSNLQYLNLAWNEIGDFGARQIATGIQANKEIRKLSLLHNRLTIPSGR